jgi:hypothetical protein
VVSYNLNSRSKVVHHRQQCFEALEPVSNAIATHLQQSPVEPFDETGMRVNDQWWWLHVACTDGLTVRLTLTAEAYYFVHPKRGQAAMEEMNILPQFEGIDSIDCVGN